MNTTAPHGTDQTRWLSLEGAANVRDLGGLPTVDGRGTVRGRILRSDNLQGLTPADVRRLVDDVGLRRVVDLRTGTEVEKEGPGPLTREPAVTIEHLSLFPEGGRLTDAGADVPQPSFAAPLLPWQTEEGRDRAARNRADLGDGRQDHPSVGYYLGYLRDRPENVVAAVRALAQPDGVAVVHCAAGKDRTGVLVALALSAVGVPREEVVADYAATGDVLNRLMARLAASPAYAPDLDGSPVDAHRPWPETMRRFLTVLDERYGGPVGWLRQAGLTDADLAALRARLLEP